MSRDDDATPIIVGVGQVSERPGDACYAAHSPMDLAGLVLANAFADTAAVMPIAPVLDTLAAIRQFEISGTRYTAPFGHADNPPRAIARRAGADPARAILEVVGGQGPQRLVGELATEIAAGRSRLAAIVGSEAISTTRLLASRGERRDWTETVGGEIEDRGYGYDGIVDATALRHGVGAPIGGYALAENVRRGRLGLTLDDYRRSIGELFAPFTQIAEGNPHSAAPRAWSIDELAGLNERNRLVAEPYGRLVVARDQVNQAAAIVMASAGEARRLGIPESRWVHIHAVADCAEPPLLQRAEMDRSPAAVSAISSALEIAGSDWNSIDFVDLYSCFAIPVFNLIEAFGLDSTDPRGWTLTGGLPFFGGAGNNYSAHAIAEAVARCRAAPGSTALVGANGGIMSKYAAGIYSTRPADWSESRWTSLPRIAAAVPVRDVADGEGRLESFTIQPIKGQEIATVVARIGGARACANSADPAAIAALRREPFAGRAVRIEVGEAGVSAFRLV